MELDVYLGFSGEMAENMTYDVGYISVNTQVIMLETLKKHTLPLTSMD